MKTKLLSILLAGLVSSAGAADFLTYSTAGHAKAQGVKITLEYPGAWTPRENSKPGIVHEFRDPATGGRDALILVVPGAQPRKMKAGDFRKSFEKEEAQELILPGARHRKKEFLENLGYSCVALDYDLEFPQFAPAVVQVRNYILLIGDRMVQLQFYAVGISSKDLRADRQEMMERVVRSVRKN